jgi:thiamine biosynthesis lipoprotein
MSQGAPPGCSVFSCRAMATQFDIVLWGDAFGRLQAAATEAMGEIEAAERLLSAFDPASEIAQLNARETQGPLRIDLRVLRLLERCVHYTEQTGGAFDVSVGPLMRVWGFRGEPEGDWPSARAATGMDKLDLDLDAGTVAFASDAVRLDLGAVGKGYAVDAAMDVLRECGLKGAMVHGGRSTAAAMGATPDGGPWQALVRDPSPGAKVPMARVELAEGAMSVSAPHGRTAGGLGHVMNPRTGKPAAASLIAAVAHPSAEATDAYSTALLVLGREGLRRLGGVEGLSALWAPRLAAGGRAARTLGPAFRLSPDPESPGS